MYNHRALFEKVRQFTCRMYVAASSTTEVNDLRFCAKRGDIESILLPPCRDCLFVHLLHWMRSPPAPDAVLELLACQCVSSCKLSTCTCMANRLAFTDMCKLQSCSNHKQQEDEDDIVELGDADDDIDEQVDV